jgi:hypothetical protein
MRRLIIGAVLGLGVLLLARRLKQAMRGSPTLAERLSEKCERMLAGLPSSFPPNRMMADLETVKARTDLILEKLNEEARQRHTEEVLNQYA